MSVWVEIQPFDGKKHEKRKNLTIFVLKTVVNPTIKVYIIYMNKKAEYIKSLNEYRNVSAQLNEKAKILLENGKCLTDGALIELSAKADSIAYKLMNAQMS